MHTGSAVPSHRETENDKENDETDEEASVVVELEVAGSRSSDPFRVEGAHRLG